MNRDLIIFVKNPVLGRAKTRLAASIGDEAALKAYLQLLSYTKQVVDELDVQKSVWYSSEPEANDLWNIGNYFKKKQQGKDLGKKMSYAFESTFRENQADAVVIIGSDCAELKPEHLNEAFEVLRSTDVVLGPAKDGGYYLLGMRQFVPELFNAIAWSTSDVAKQTLDAAEKKELSYKLLEELSDVDTEEDWKKVKHRLPKL
ncbi:MAG: TIGR04282 family arsenosugar biosynthesis glycosyltransferase [Balneolaceae bacterium]|nr:TIGR04282 family arsenosugar biosynthesis glycosyltransferase [Balneolaceae bacterium]